jgi:hypothetical protein
MISLQHHTMIRRITLHMSKKAGLRTITFMTDTIRMTVKTIYYMIVDVCLTFGMIIIAYLCPGDNQDND